MLGGEEREKGEKGRKQNTLQSFLGSERRGILIVSHKRPRLLSLFAKLPLGRVCSPELNL